MRPHQVLLGCGSERRWLRLVDQRLGHLFPYLPTPSAYNRRLRRAGPLVALAIPELALHTPSWHDQLRLVDSTPVPCAASRETVNRSAPTRSARLWSSAGSAIVTSACCCRQDPPANPRPAPS